jgi:hypothetical protein
LELSAYASVWPKSSSDLWDLDFHYGLALAIGFPKP